MTVFIVHELDNKALRDNLEPARKFGEFRYVNRYYIHGDELEVSSYIIPHAALIDIPEFVEHRRDYTIPMLYYTNMRLAAEAFDPAVDFLLIVGDHLQIIALSAILAARYESFMVLRYDRKISDYVPVRLHSGLRTEPARARVTPHRREDHGQDRNPKVAQRPEDYHATGQPVPYKPADGQW